MAPRDVSRRDALKHLAAAGAVVTTAGCTPRPRQEEDPMSERPEAVVAVSPLQGLHWQTRDPFLFCAHHDDHYPAGNEEMGPAAPLHGRRIGMDFDGKDGWRMYHGDVVPGFPQHPHRGFETVTIVRRGLLDHSDSLGAAARFGEGDVQWLTAGQGILHAEMFPLLRPDADNPVELFQIWLNLPRASKMVEPHFSMLWNDMIPRHLAKDAAGRTTEIAIIAGQLGGAKAPAPPPASWAAHADADVAMWTLKMAPSATFTLPATRAGTGRTLYFFAGESLRVGSRDLTGARVLELRPDVDAVLENGPAEAELLLLQGRPIGEPVAQHGPFVMNTRDEIRQAYLDYQRTQFGGWPWQRADPVHPRAEGRFARHVDGRIERPA